MNKPSKPNLNFATGITHDMPGTSATRRRTERRRRLCFCLLIFSHDERDDLQSNMRKIRKIWPSIAMLREALVCFVSVKNFSSSTVSQMLTQSLNTIFLCLSFSCVTLFARSAGIFSFVFFFSEFGSSIFSLRPSSSNRACLSETITRAMAKMPKKVRTYAFERHLRRVQHRLREPSNRVVRDPSVLLSFFPLWYNNRMKH